MMVACDVTRCVTTSDAINVLRSNFSLSQCSTSPFMKFIPSLGKGASQQNTLNQPVKNRLHVLALVNIVNCRQLGSSENSQIWDCQ